MSYILKHTAEELDLKLDLIDENKNLLEYPYTIDKSKLGNLVDVGDGSFLLPANTSSGFYYKLRDQLLPAGTYIASAVLENALNPTDSVASNICVPSLNILLKDGVGALQDEFGKFTLTTETTVEVYLTVYTVLGTFPTDVLIKPQIEAGEVKTTWVPNMDRIGTYVDRRFNSLNAKIKVLTDLINVMASGSGLPDCTGLPNGAILAVKDGAWVIDTTLVDDDILVVEPDDSGNGGEGDSSEPSLNTYNVYIDDQLVSVAIVAAESLSWADVVLMNNNFSLQEGEVMYQGKYLTYNGNRIYATEPVVHARYYYTETSDNETINFMVDGITYTANTGEDWQSWIDREEPNGFSRSELGPVYFNGYRIYSYPDHSGAVDNSYEIVDSHNYYAITKQISIDGNTVTVTFDTENGQGQDTWEYVVMDNGFSLDTENWLIMYNGKYLGETSSSSGDCVIMTASPIGPYYTIDDTLTDALPILELDTTYSVDVSAPYTFKFRVDSNPYLYVNLPHNGEDGADIDLVIYSSYDELMSRENGIEIFNDSDTAEGFELNTNTWYYAEVSDANNYSSSLDFGIYTSRELAEGTTSTEPTPDPEPAIGETGTYAFKPFVDSNGNYTDAGEYISSHLRTNGIYKTADFYGKFSVVGDNRDFALLSFHDDPEEGTSVYTWTEDHDITNSEAWDTDMLDIGMWDSYEYSLSDIIVLETPTGVFAEMLEHCCVKISDSTDNPIEPDPDDVEYTIEAGTYYLYNDGRNGNTTGDYYVLFSSDVQFSCSACDGAYEFGVAADGTLFCEADDYYELSSEVVIFVLYQDVIVNKTTYTTFWHYAEKMSDSTGSDEPDDSGDSGSSTDSIHLNPGVWYIADGGYQNDDGVTIFNSVKNSGVALPHRINFDGGIFTYDIEHSEYSSYNCYGITFQPDGRITFNLEDAEDLDAWSDYDDGDDVWIEFSPDFYPDGLTLTGNDAKIWNAVFHEQD